MKRNKLLILLAGLLILGLGACANSTNDEAMKKVDEARRVFIEERNYEEAYDLLDEVGAYSEEYNAKAYAEMLRDSIKVCESRLAIDVLDDRINRRKILILESTDEEEIKRYQQEMDSLDNIKNPFRTIITNITNRELKRSACQQCVTAMRNIRK